MGNALVFKSLTEQVNDFRIQKDKEMNHMIVKYDQNMTHHDNKELATKLKEKTHYKNACQYYQIAMNLYMEDNNVKEANICKKFVAEMFIEQWMYDEAAELYFELGNNQLIILLWRTSSVHFYANYLIFPLIRISYMLH